MNIILSNPVISEFLADYPKEKHVNCLLGIILLGIYNMKTFSIDFTNILSQIELKQSMSSFQIPEEPSKKLEKEGEKPEDTPRFLNLEKPSEKRSNSSKKVLKPAKSIVLPAESFKKLPFHAKTPSIVNPDIRAATSPVEKNSILQIADHFLNGRFVNEYCNSQFSLKNKKQVPKLGIHIEKVQIKPEEARSRPVSSGLSSSSHSGRYNSFSVLAGNRSIRGDRITSYSKFW